MSLLALIIFTLLYCQISEAEDFFWELNSESKTEIRYFHKEAAYLGQKNTYSSSLSSEFYADFNNDINLIIEPRIRYDLYDKNRNKLDISQGYFIYFKDKYEYKVGVAKIFWGITESKNLVDIINTNDLVDIDPKAKLGQPLMTYSIATSFLGVFDFYYLPLFIRSSETGRRGRIRLSLPKQKSSSYYEGGAGKRQPSWAVKWENSYGRNDLSFQVFRGISRDSSTITEIEDNNLNYFSGYERITQLGTYFQKTQGPLIYKFEGIKRYGQRNAKLIRDNYFSSILGLEYVVTRIFNKVWDLNFFLEYSNDDRNNDSTDYLQNDLFLGLKLFINDTSGTEFIASTTTDLDGGGNTGKLEVSSRLTDNIRLSTEYNYYWSTNSKDILYSFRRDNYLGFNIKKYF